MKRAARERAPGEFQIPDGMRQEDLCSVSYLRPVDGCPTYTEYFKAGDAIPSAVCPIHEGSFKQNASRVITGFFKSLGSKLGSIFKR